MESLAFSGVLLIEETPQVSGRPLWLSLVSKAAKLNFGVKILMFAEVEQDLKQLLAGRNVEYVDCLRGCKTLPELTQLLVKNSTGTNKKVALAIDCLTILTRRFGADPISNLLGLVAQTCPILTRYQKAGLNDVECNRLRSITHAVLILSTDNDRKRQLCQTISLKKDGDFRQKLETYEINAETKEMTCQLIKQETAPQKVEQSKSDFAPCHPASVDRVKKEKAGVILPFTRAQKQEGLVGLNANRKTLGAKIEYFADQEDDLDDEDPDEELMY